jgi:hypothetical protein
LIPNPSFDTERLEEESLAELASAKEAGTDVPLSDLVSADELPPLALLDLSVVDSRFGPELIAAQVAHLLEAWEGATVGSESPLEGVASDQARAALLRPSPGRRLVVRDAVMKSWQATRLDLSRRPPTVEVSLDVEAVRYVVNDAGTHVAGNRTDARPIALTWLLELAEGSAVPWRLVASNNPAEAIPGLT